MLHVRGPRLTTVKPSLRSYVRVSSLGAPQAGATFTCDFFEVGATIDVDGATGDSGAGYRAGFTQLQWIETNRAYYRGRMDADGSVNVERDRPPARPAQACRDAHGPVHLPARRRHCRVSCRATRSTSTWQPFLPSPP